MVAKSSRTAVTCQSPDLHLFCRCGQLLVVLLLHCLPPCLPLLPYPQGEKEAAAGIPVTPPCDASKVCMPAAQLFFIERFMAPTLEAFRSSAPAFYNMAAAWLADTQVCVCVCGEGECALAFGRTARPLTKGSGNRAKGFREQGEGQECNGVSEFPSRIMQQSCQCTGSQGKVMAFALALMDRGWLLLLPKST